MPCSQECDRIRWEFLIAVKNSIARNVLNTNHLKSNDFSKSSSGYNSFMELLSVKQAAEELGLSENRVREFCQEGRFGEKVGHQWIITRAELEDFKKIPRKRGNPRKNSA